MSNESGQTVETKLEQPQALPTKGKKRTEAEAALRGVDRIAFPDVCEGGGEVWYRTLTQLDNGEAWWSDSRLILDRYTGTEEIYRRTQAERCFVNYARKGVPYGGIENTAYDVVCRLVSRLLRKQVSYKEFRESFWKAVEGPADERPAAQ